MSAKTRVCFYFGPLEWFESAVPDRSKSFIEAVFAQDEENRKLKVVLPKQPGSDDSDRDARPAHRRRRRLMVRSGDYSTLQEHVMQNFPALVRALDPKEVHLHNPPRQVLKQLAQAFPGAEERRFDYPIVSLESLARFKAKFEAAVVGQQRPLDAILAALYPLTKVGRARPVVIMFYGPSGVGKTETAKLLNQTLSGKMFRKQFSMFQNDQFSAYLFGGRHSEAAFARDLLDRESGVILIDEFDKANRVFHSAFYQFFDEGVYEDRNYEVNVGPAVVICTSNYKDEDEVRSALGDALFSRFDSLVRFEQLGRDDFAVVVERILEEVISSNDPADLACVDIDQVRSLLLDTPGAGINVRKLAKVANEVVSLLIVRSRLKELPPASV